MGLHSNKMSDIKLILDIGNSALKGGLFDGSSIVKAFCLNAPGNLTTDDFTVELGKALDGCTPVYAGIASVVPSVSEKVCSVLNLPHIFVHPGMRLPFELAYLSPQTLGTDRLAAAVAGWTLFGRHPDGTTRNVLVIDAGTALNYEVIDRHGTYLGGGIASGPATALRALVRETAQLPEVQLTLPLSIVGRNTDEAIRAGIVYGFIDSVSGMIRRIEALLDGQLYVVATGGWSPILMEHISSLDFVEPHLVLYGISALLDLNEPFVVD